MKTRVGKVWIEDVNMEGQEASGAGEPADGKAMQETPVNWQTSQETSENAGENAPESTAQRLLRLVSAHEERDFARVIAREKDWEVLSALSPICWNIVEWLPITKKQTVLEIGSGYGALTGILADRAASVTCLEPSREASRVNAVRNREREGIRILTGSGEEQLSRLEDRFDWVLLIGTLEAARDYVEGKAPWKRLLKLAAEKLAPGGRLVIAADNRLGLKYFAGCREPHSGEYFAGIEGYAEQAQARTFSGPELEEMAVEAGFSTFQRYYPYPDYRLPMTIYSDDRLPLQGELWDNMRNFDRERYVLFDETKAWNQVIRDGLFPVFSNSFLFLLQREAGPVEERILFSKYSNERSRRFAIRTDIAERADGSRFARKSACYPEGEAHVAQLPVWREKLEREYAGTRLRLNGCRGNDGNVELDYLTGTTLEEELDALTAQGKTAEAAKRMLEYLEEVQKTGSRQIFKVTPEFERVFGQVCLPPDLMCGAATDVDMVTGNAVRSGEGWIHMDYEWTFDFPVPVHYVMFRAIQNYLYGNIVRREMQHQQLYKRAGLTELEVAQYTKMEESFQRYIVGNHRPLRLLYDTLSPGCVNFHREEERRSAQVRANAAANQGIDIFVDTFELAMTAIHVYGWAVSRAERRVTFSLLDGSGKKLETLGLEYLYRRDVAERFGLGGKTSKAGFHLECRLPAQEQRERKFTLVAEDGLCRVPFEIPVEKLRLKQTKVGQKLMELRGAKDVIQLIAPKQMGFLGESRRYRVENQRFDTWRLAHRLSEQEKECQRRETFSYEPKISVLLEGGSSGRDCKRTIESVLRQTWNQVEIVLAFREKHHGLSELLQKQYEEESQVVCLKGRLQEALTAASGEYVLRMRPGDILEDSAFYEMVRALNENREIHMLYTDSDSIDWEKKTFFDPRFKPDDSPYTLLSGNYIGSACLLEKKIARLAGGFRESDGRAALYGLILRMRDRTGGMTHLQKLLYHENNPENRREDQQQELLQEWEDGRRVLEEFLKATGRPALVQWANFPLRYRARWQVQGKPLVSILIPNQDHVQDLQLCISSILERSTWKNYEILVVENNSRREETFRYYRKLEERCPRVRVLQWKQAFNFSAINNFAARKARGEYLIFLNNDTEVLTPDWMEELLFLCQQEDVGIVGTKLYYPDGTLQHVGVILGLGRVAGHLFVKEPGTIPGYMGRACTLQNLSAVTAACMMTEKALFDQVGGFDETLEVALNDVDYCMKVTGAGKQVLFNPEAELYHYESKSRGQEDTPEKQARYEREVAYFQSKWQERLMKGDPCYNPNLSRTSWSCALRIPPKEEERERE